MDYLPQNLGESSQVLLDYRAEITVERLQHIVASLPRCPVAIVPARGENTLYWPGIDKTTATVSIMQPMKFVWLNLPQLLSTGIRYSHAANFSKINKFHHKFNKMYIKQNST